MAIFSAIVGAITAISTWTIGGFAAGAFLLQTAAGIGLNLLAQAIAGKPQDPKFSVNGTLQAGGDIPRSIVLGYACTAGSLVYANTWGHVDKTDNAFLTHVIALTDYPVQELREFWVNGELVTIDYDNEHEERGFPVTEYFKDGSNHLWIKFYDGTQTEADAFLVNRVSKPERPYEATRVGVGVAYAVVTAKVTKNLFSGFPSFKFGLYGARLYDPSRDSTRGGSGPQREAQPGTWGGDGDFLPAVQIYSLLRGISFGGRWLYGLQGMSANRIPVAHQIDQINKCRAEIMGADGLEPTYRSGGEIEIAAPLGDAVEALMTACQGRLGETGGRYKLFLGAPGPAVASFTDDDIISAEGQSFTPFFGLADTINGISARYPSPAEAWNTKVAPPLYRPDLEALAGNRRLMADVALDFVPYAEQVQRLMKSALEEAQRARRHTFVLPPQFWVLEPGDIVSWTSARNGYVTKLFRVDGVIDRANLDVMVDLTEVDPSDYDWDTGADFKPPVDGPIFPVRPQPQPIIGWFAEKWQIEDEDGKPRRPAIKLHWDGEQDDVDAVAYEVALASTMEVQHRNRTDEVQVGELVISGDWCLSRETYVVRGRYVPRSDRDVVWSSWLPVTMDDIRLGPGDVDFEEIAKDIRDFVDDATEWSGPALRALINDARRLVASVLDQSAVDYDDRQLIREQVASAHKDAKAYADLQILAATGPGSAIALALIDIGAQLGDKASTNSVLLLQSRVDDVEGDLEAISNAVIAVDAKVGDVSAFGAFRAEAGVSPGGGWSRVGLVASATSGSTFEEAAIWLDARTSGPYRSRVGVKAGQFFITNGTVENDVFVYEGDILYVENIRAGDVVFKRLRSDDGKLEMRGVGGTYFRLRV